MQGTMSQEKQLRRELEACESFTHAHARKGTRPFDKSKTSLEIVYVDDRSRIFVEKYKGLLVDKYGPDNADHPPFDQELWDQCSGGRKKGRGYGSSTLSYPCYVLTVRPSTQSNNSSSSSSYSSYRQSEIQKLNEKLEEIQEERERERASIQEERQKEREEMRDREERLQRESKENAEAVRKEMNDKISEMMKFINYPRSSPPPPPPSS